jgi:hypothetical protein
MAFHVKDLLIAVIPVDPVAGTSCEESASLCTHPVPTDAGCDPERKNMMLVDPEYFVELRGVLEHALKRVNAAIRGEPAQPTAGRAAELRNQLSAAVKELEAKR